jgi:hypothetical protein
MPNSPPFDTTCLYSTVKNLSGAQKLFSFLPPHGRTLQNLQEFTVFGDITEAIIRHGRDGGRANILALERAMARGDMVITKSKAPILKDVTNAVVDKTYMIQLHGTTLVAVPPCWTSSASKAPQANYNA